MSSNLKLGDPYNPLAEPSDVFRTPYNNMLENIVIYYNVYASIQRVVYKRFTLYIYSTY